MGDDADRADDEHRELPSRHPRIRDWMARERWHVAIHHAHDRRRDPSKGEGMHQREDWRLVEKVYNFRHHKWRRSNAACEPNHRTREKMDRQPPDTQ